MDNKIQEFVGIVKESFNLTDVEIGIEYVYQFGFYRIWHTRQELEEVVENRKIIGDILREIFSSKEARDIVVLYDYCKDIINKKGVNCNDNKETNT